MSAPSTPVPAATQSPLSFYEPESPSYAPSTPVLAATQSPLSFYEPASPSCAPSTPVPATQSPLSFNEPTSPSCAPSTSVVVMQSTHFIDLTSEDDEDEDEQPHKKYKRTEPTDVEIYICKIQKLQDIILSKDKIIQNYEEINRMHVDTIENHNRIIGEKNRVINKEFKSDCNDELHRPNFDIGCTNSWCTRRELKIEEDSNQIEVLENTIIEYYRTINQMTTDISQLKSQI